MMPENAGAPEASAIPKQSGIAIRKTTILAGKSAETLEKKPFD